MKARAIVEAESPKGIFKAIMSQSPAYYVKAGQLHTPSKPVPFAVIPDGWPTGKVCFKLRSGALCVAKPGRLAGMKVASPMGSRTEIQVWDSSYVYPESWERPEIETWVKRHGTDCSSVQPRLPEPE